MSNGKTQAGMSIWVLLLCCLLASPVLAEAPLEISWDDMMPEDWLPPMPDIMEHDYFEMVMMEQLAPDAPVVPGLDNLLVRLPGFVVPLKMDGRRVAEFLFVPYLGACIHVPPPPSNQIVHVRLAQPQVLDEPEWNAFWITGRLQVQHSESELAHAGYSMLAERIEIYEWDD